MKSIFILIVLFANFNAYCQSKVECTFIDKAIHSDEFAKRFSVNKYESPDLIIVDENRYIDSCNLNPIAKKEVHVSREQKYKFENVPKEAKNVIVLHKMDRLKKGYRLHFWRPINNAMLVLESVKNKKGICITVISSGSY